MTERIPTKWAVIEPEPVATNLDAIHDAVTDDRLLEVALQDFITEFVTFVMVGKTAREAMAALDCWRGWLETVRRHSK